MKQFKDKLEVARRLGYLCGPTGVEVPHPATYIVRPCINLMGMSRGANFQFIESNTDDIVPIGHFWCEVFEGRHLSIDYHKGQQVLAVEGFRPKGEELYKYCLWEKVDVSIPLPKICVSLIEKYEFVNVEFINKKPIEIHLRHNPDFTNKEINAIVPVWDDEGANHPDFISDPDYKRRGFIVLK
jgi:hypothetical protein